MKEFLHVVYICMPQTVFPTNKYETLMVNWLKIINYLPLYAIYMPVPITNKSISFEGFPFHFY